jgi:hypothetical protein
MTSGASVTGRERGGGVLAARLHDEEEWHGAMRGTAAADRGCGARSAQGGRKGRGRRALAGPNLLLRWHGEKRRENGIGLKGVLGLIDKTKANGLQNLIFEFWFKV